MKTPLISRQGSGTRGCVDRSPLRLQDTLEDDDTPTSTRKVFPKRSSGQLRKDTASSFEKIHRATAKLLDDFVNFVVRNTARSRAAAGVSTPTFRRSSSTSYGGAGLKCRNAEMIGNN
ncbi:hypothetical protein THAOC_03200 [Thalassiosira oceanica]|uniref:Uncharacterized protein n=1 Tax=Thalassiosira oceanica TaxID=159749 RepID=K0T8M5_THAOC|nr:hypothetical protein THAOC_03200 [Thalassiosira oceanica]|eukprot:EJK75093.1 hypothetical protein THAOC_03200 [Thalassiosira oceanica]